MGKSWSRIGLMVCPGVGIDLGFYARPAKAKGKSRSYDFVETDDVLIARRILASPDRKKLLHPSINVKFN